MTGIRDLFDRKSERRLNRIYDRLSATPEGRDVVAFIKDNDINVRMEKDGVAYAAGFVTITKIVGTEYIYGPFSIALNEELNDDNLLQALVHETQHLRHHDIQRGNPDFWPSDEDHCLIRRVQEADAQAYTTHVIYGLKLIGDDGPYEEVLKTDYKSMAVAYDETYKYDPASIHDGRAQRAAFDAWFENRRNNRFYDRDSITRQIPFLQSRLYENMKTHTITPAPLTQQWLEKIADLSPVNYFKLPGTDFITNDRYRYNILKNINFLAGPPAPSNP